MSNNKYICYKCNTTAKLKCADPKCDNLICEDHAHKIRHAIKCEDCWLKDRRIGLIKKYSIILAMVVILIVLVINS